MRFALHITVLSALLLGSCSDPQQKEEVAQPTLVMPVIGDKKFNGKDTVYHTIAEFSFVNQYGDTITQNTVKDKIYVTNFFFATCQSICPRMNSQMSRVQKAFERDPGVLFLSHSINPLHDTVEVLAQYAAKYGAIKGKWHLLTGDKKRIYDLAKRSYLINAVEDDGTEEGFIHSEYLLLIDKQRRIRALYDGTDSVQVNKLIGDIKLLETEGTPGQGTVSDQASEPNTVRDKQEEKNEPIKKEKQ